NNAVFHCDFPQAPSPIWYVGDEGTNDQSSTEYPAGDFNTGIPRNGNIKFSVVVGPNPFGFNPYWATVTIYAADTDPFTGQLLDIQKSSDGGLHWAAVSAEPPNYMSSQGWYDSTIQAVDANLVYVGGADPGTGKGYILESPSGGGGWVDVTLDGNGN